MLTRASRQISVRESDNVQIMTVRVQSSTGILSFSSPSCRSAVGYLLQNKKRIISQGDKTVGPRSSLFIID